MLTHHAKRRLFERVDVSSLNEYEIYPFIESLLNNAVIEEVYDNGDLKLTNSEYNISFIVKNNLVKTIINRQAKKVKNKKRKLT